MLADSRQAGRDPQPPTAMPGTPRTPGGDRSTQTTALWGVFWPSDPHVRRGRWTQAGHSLSTVLTDVSVFNLI